MWGILCFMHINPKTLPKSYEKSTIKREINFQYKEM